MKEILIDDVKKMEEQQAEMQAAQAQAGPPQAEAGGEAAQQLLRAVQ